MREITCAAITATVRDLCIQANCQLPSDVRSAICAACAQERSPVGQSILHDLVENYTYAGERNLPICQDTGMAVVFIDLGQECHITGGALEDAVNAGVAAGYTDGFLRKSIVSDPLRRVNTEDNTPAVLHLRLVPGDQMSITVAPKGAGSENMTPLKMLKYSNRLYESYDFCSRLWKPAPTPVLRWWWASALAATRNSVPCWLSGRCCVPWTSTTLTRCIGKWRSVCWNVSIS